MSNQSNAVVRVLLADFIDREQQKIEAVLVAAERAGRSCCASASWPKMRDTLRDSGLTAARVEAVLSGYASEAETTMARVHGRRPDAVQGVERSSGKTASTLDATGVRRATADGRLASLHAEAVAYFGADSKLAAELARLVEPYRPMAPIIRPSEIMASRRAMGLDR